ncbi:MAG: hypothetical protein U5K30_05300 [Acidimicrobiales bacterium]|nr:hypothetical protein [Acidimicrobiales bacterium]
MSAHTCVCPHAKSERAPACRPAISRYWQLPLEIDRDGDHATLRPWTRADWGEGGETVHWCCTEGGLAYDGDRPVIESMAEEVEALLGPDATDQVRVHIRRRP